jgi:hypothetical protein
VYGLNELNWDWVSGHLLAYIALFPTDIILEDWVTQGDKKESRVILGKKKISSILLITRLGK